MRVDGGAAGRRGGGADDDELNINPPTPCQIGKRPPAPKPKRESAGHQGAAGVGYRGGGAAAGWRGGGGAVAVAAVAVCGL